MNQLYSNLEACEALCTYFGVFGRFVDKKMGHDRSAWGRYSDN